MPNASVASKHMYLIRSGMLLTGLIASYSLLSSTACSQDNRAFVRVNQIGYVTGRHARAYLMAKNAIVSGKFAVNDSQGAAVFSGSIGDTTGSWGRYKVYPLDFSVAKPGAYSIAVVGPLSASSPVFRVDAADNLYKGALSNALKFYQDQRDGADFISSGLRKAPGHLNDRNARVYQTPQFGGREGSRINGDLVPTGATIDASGGWWDAGDYLKFVHTTSYVVALMLVGRRDFPGQMGPGFPATDFTSEARFGLDWLLRMWDDNSRTLYYQVGIGSGISGAENDHSIWRLPQDDDTLHGDEARYRYIRNRPVFVAGAAGTKISPNLAGRLAGDFALGYQVFRISDPAFAQRCLSAAEHIFAQADTTPQGRLLTAAPFDFYGESEWHDDLEFGAAELFLALRTGNLPRGLPQPDDNFYLQSAAIWAAQYIRNRDSASGVLSVGDISSLAHFDLYRAMNGIHGDLPLAVKSSDLLADLRKSLDAAAAQAAKDPFNFGLPWGEGDTAARGTALAVMASQYHYLTQNTNFSMQAQQWTGNILGANAWGAAFIVADGTTFPNCIHHQIANLIGSHNGQNPILAGAVVEGPLADPESGMPAGAVACPSGWRDSYSAFNGNNAIYKDNVKFYATNEPAIDLTAPSFLMFAWQLAGAPRNLASPIPQAPH